MIEMRIFNFVMFSFGCVTLGAGLFIILMQSHKGKIEWYSVVGLCCSVYLVAVNLPF